MAKARLGQNFLTDHDAARRIVDALGDTSTSLVIEIGPGHGVLTQILTERAARVIAVELDEMLATKLHVAFDGKANVEIVQADFLKLDLADLIRSRQQNPSEGSSGPSRRRAGFARLRTAHGNLTVVCQCREVIHTASRSV